MTVLIILIYLKLSELEWFKSID